MEQAPIDVVVAAYTSEDGAKNALHELNEARKERVVDIKDAAVLRKDMDDKLHVVDVKDLGVFLDAAEHKWIEEVERRIQETGAEIATDMIGADIAAQLEMEAEKQSGGETRAA